MIDRVFSISLGTGLTERRSVAGTAPAGIQFTRTLDAGAVHWSVGLYVLAPGEEIAGDGCVRLLQHRSAFSSQTGQNVHASRVLKNLGIIGARCQRDVDVPFGFDEIVLVVGEVVVAQQALGGCVLGG